MKRINKILFSTLLAGIIMLGAVQSPALGTGLNGSDGLSDAGDGVTKVVAETASGTTEDTDAGEGVTKVVAETASETTEDTVAVSTEPAPESIELSGGSAYARTILNSHGLGSDQTFSSVRYVSTERKTTAMDGDNPNTWGWPTVYLGITDDNSLDLSKATDLSIELKATGAGIWVKWRAVDVDGTVAKVVNYSNAGGVEGDLTQIDTGEKFNVVSRGNTNDYQGTWLNNTTSATPALAGVVLHSDIVNDGNWAVDAESQRVTGADDTFDTTQVVALMVSVSAYYEKTVDIGSVRVTIGGQESVLWDADKAVEKKYAEVFTEETKAFSNFDLDQNEWYFGSMPKGITNDPSTWSVQTLSATYEYKDDNALEYTYASGATDAWTPLYKDDGLNFVAKQTTMDLSACNAMVFDADFTGAEGTSAIDFMIRPTDGSSTIQYKSTGRAFLIAENGTVTTCVGNAYPAGFKGKVILPFTSFQKVGATSVLLSDCAYLNNVQHITAIIVATRTDTYQADDTVKLSNIQVLKKDEQELDILNKVAEFRLNFKMQETAELSYDPFGIRFGVTAGNMVYKNVVEALEGVPYEFGMVIVPNTDAYASVMPNQEGILTVKKVDSGEESEDTYWYSWYAGIKQIGPGGYEIGFVARAYLQYTIGGTTYTVWATTAGNSASLYELATAAKESGVDNADVEAVLSSVKGQ